MSMSMPVEPRESRSRKTPPSTAAARSCPPRPNRCASASTTTLTAAPRPVFHGLGEERRRWRLLRITPVPKAMTAPSIPSRSRPHTKAATAAGRPMAKSSWSRWMEEETLKRSPTERDSTHPAAAASRAIVSRREKRRERCTADQVTGRAARAAQSLMRSPPAIWVRQPTSTRSTAASGGSQAQRSAARPPSAPAAGAGRRRPLRSPAASAAPAAGAALIAEAAAGAPLRGAAGKGTPSVTSVVPTTRSPNRLGRSSTGPTAAWRVCGGRLWRRPARLPCSRPHSCRPRSRSRRSRHPGSRPSRHPGSQQLRHPGRRPARRRPRRRRRPRPSTCRSPAPGSACS